MILENPIGPDRPIQCPTGNYMIPEDATMSYRTLMDPIGSNRHRALHELKGIYRNQHALTCF